MSKSKRQKPNKKESSNANRNNRDTEFAKELSVNESKKSKKEANKAENDMKYSNNQDTYL